MPHIHDQIDFVVSVFIVHKNRILLIHHKQLGQWLPIGGHIELDEDPEQALFREIQEETGLGKKDLTILSAKPNIRAHHSKILFTPNYLDIHKINDHHRHVGLIYFATSTTDQVQLAPQEHNHIRWFTRTQLKDLDLLPEIRFYANQALKIAN